MLTATRPSLMDLTMHDMAQKQPWLSQTMEVVLHLAGRPPALSGLRKHVASHLPRLPCLTHYLHGPGLRARWAHDPRPDLEQRIRERTIAPGQAHLDATLQDLLPHPLPRNSPPWDLWLLHGHSADQYTLCYRFHHACQDGAALRNVLYTLFNAAPAITPAQPEPRAGLRVRAQTFKGMLSALARNDIWNDPARPLHNSRIGTWASAPTHVLRDIAAARGGSSNDAFLAALATAVRTWTRSHWSRGADRAVPAVMMVDVRRAHEADHPGNLFAYATLLLPSHQPTHQDRLDSIIAATREPKSPMARTATRTILDKTPTYIGRGLAAQLTTPPRAVINTSHVAFHRLLHYQGDPVTHIQMTTWLPRNHPASVIACSYNGTTSAYFLTDAALPEFHQLAAWWEQAINEAHVSTAST